MLTRKPSGNLAVPTKHPFDPLINHFITTSFFPSIQIISQQTSPSPTHLNLQTHPHRRQNPNIAAGVDAVLLEIVGRALRDFVVVDILNIEINDQCPVAEIEMTID
jgi:hypothetical protein